MVVLRNNPFHLAYPNSKYRTQMAHIAKNYSSWENIKKQKHTKYNFLLRNQLQNKYYVIIICIYLQLQQSF